MPSMTLTEKILARASQRNAVQPGDNIWIDVDVLMTHDVCGPGTIGVFKQHFSEFKAQIDGFKADGADFRLLFADSQSEKVVALLGHKPLRNPKRSCCP